MDRLIDQQGTTSFETAPELTPQEKQLIDIAAPIGQNNWFNAQIAQGHRLPHPDRDFIIEGKKGHPGLMSYETMQFIYDYYYEGKMAPQHGKILPRADLMTMLAKDFGDIDSTEFAYIGSLSPEVYRKWMITISVERIKDNNAWGLTAAHFLRKMNIPIEKVLSGKLNTEEESVILALESGIESIHVPSNVAQMKELLNQNVPLKVAMIAAHNNWRELRYGKALEKADVTFDIELELANLEDCIGNNNLNLSDEIQNIRQRAHSDASLSSEVTFMLMLDIAEKLEGMIEKLGEDNPNNIAILNHRNNILDTIRWDANPAIASCLLHNFKEN